MRATTSLPRRSSMSVIRTRAPSRARVSEQASPMPEAPPVTMATLPFSDIVAVPPSCGPLLGPNGTLKCPDIHLTLSALAMSNDRVAEIMNMSRWLAVLAAVVLIVPVMADARVGGGTSSGSRGSNTGAAPAPTKTAPSAAPIERSATPTQSAKPVTNVAQAAPAAQGGFFSRHPFLGGMLGAGLFGMMFGGGFGGASGMFGLIFQLALIGGLAYLALRLFRGRMA